MEEKPGAPIINTDELELNKLFKELLDGVRDDITEATENVEIYHTAIENDTGSGKEIYGPAYNDALKIKGLARARQLSFLGMFKDRVSVKEKNTLVIEAKNAATAGATQGIDHSSFNKAFEEYNNAEIDDDEEEDDDE